ncbi:MAG: type I-C CRISPR-associated endonuclease Cas1c [Endomicrobiaceae bacterium]|nr:type I-C CRISPR-associated endonuclease Cas1c [Endomicrobiaceae bacterium]
MKKLLNTLYVTTPDVYVSLDGENVVIIKDNNELGRVPLHNLEGIVVFGYTGASPALMGSCAKHNISLCFMTQYGKFLSRISGEVRGNVTLRKTQYFLSDKKEESIKIARNFIIGKIYNSRWVIERAVRDHSMRVDVQKLKDVSDSLKKSIDVAVECEEHEILRGIEGEAAKLYFSVFNDLILQQKEHFSFNGRNKRPPLDNVNALLSFAYTLLTNNIVSALETVGLDPYVGFMHTDRPGRVSLALDLLEELRSVFADRFVISLINKKMISSDGFIKKENGAIIMDDDTKKIFLSAYQEKKQEKITHPFLEEKIEWGMVPYIQSLLLARFIRGDIEEYPPFLWK